MEKKNKIKSNWNLIDNFSQEMLSFRTKKELLEYAQKRGYKAEKSPFISKSFWLNNAL